MNQHVFVQLWNISHSGETPACLCTFLFTMKIHSDFNQIIWLFLITSRRNQCNAGHESDIWVFMDHLTVCRFVSCNCQILLLHWCLYSRYVTAYVTCLGRLWVSSEGCFGLMATDGRSSPAVNKASFTVCVKKSHSHAGMWSSLVFKNTDEAEVHKSRNINSTVVKDTLQKSCK